MLKQVRASHPYGVKYPSFTVRDGQVTDSLGPPDVQAKRLDGKGEASAGTGGYATAQSDAGRTLRWWPTEVTFSSRGCWQVTEKVGNTSITYIVKI